MRSDNGLYPQRRLKELISLEYGDSLPNENRLGGHCPVLGSNGIVGYHDKPKVNGPGIVVGRKGSIGQVTWVSEDFWPIDTTYYVEQKTRHDRHWLYYLLEQLHLERLNSATGVPGLNREDAYALSVPVPTEVQTRKIAEIIQAIDDAIEATQAVIKQTRQLKAALLQDLLTNGLPGRHSDFKIVKHLGRMPKSWEVRAIGEVFEVQLGKMLSQASKTGTAYRPYIGNWNVQWGRFDLGRIEQMDFTDDEFEKFRLRSGDILVCEGGEVGRTAIWKSEIKGCCYQKALHRLRPKLDVGIVPAFFMYFMEQGTRQNIFVPFTGESSIAHLTRETLIQLPMPIPNYDEQETIVEVLEEVENRIRAEEEKACQIGKLKRSLS